MTFPVSPEDKILLKRVLLFAKKNRVKLYLVGGYLRDIFLKREKENPDMDFCIRKNAISFGRRLAAEIAAGFVVLDKEHGCCRLVKRMNKKTYTLDFTDFRGKDLDGDLLHRDFTVNSLALGLEEVFAKGEDWLANIYDPYGGRKDLKLKIIRAVNNKTFDEDPLRILRAFSLSAIFGFKIDKATLKLIIRKRKKLAHVSYERMRDELFKILDSSSVFEFVRKLDDLKILKIIIPEIEAGRGLNQGPYHHLDIWDHSLETLRQIEALIKELKNNKEIRDYLDEAICGERRRRALVKLGALLHDIGKPGALRREDGKIKFHGHERIGSNIAGDIARRLKLSNAELASLRKMVFWHLRPGYLADNEEITPRATYRYFRDTAEEAISVLLISLADQRSTRGRLTSLDSRQRHEKTAFGLIKEYFRRKKEKKFKRILDGNDLMKAFKLEQSPLIGRVLSAVEEAQAIGKIKTKKEALSQAKKFLQHRAKI